MMENIQVLLLLAMLFFSLFRFINKEKKTATTPLPLPLDDEELINVEMSEIPVPTEQPPKSKLNTIHKKAASLDRRAKVMEKNHTVITTPLQQNSSVTTPSAPIKIKNRSEARKAFIYSEIFKRKY